MEVCNKFGVDFVDKAIIPYLSSNTKNDFKIIQDGFNKKSTNLLSSSKPLLLSVSSKRSSQEPEGEEPKGESPKPNNSPRSTG